MLFVLVCASSLCFRNVNYSIRNVNYRVRHHYKKGATSEKLSMKFTEDGEPACQLPFIKDLLLYQALHKCYCQFYNSPEKDCCQFYR